ncbi:DUF2141 domain-containing protein [Pseudoalteromonas luteoviolacea]|uniref:DUF2141 domain-containing protein n=1 Tax=Pseudoalteromonas luteoviolacea DSM 6061 TaxID=1365250 RepID=A0A166XRY6_9GAMM|nr:DUF2141 domain-containing protein [Pseudoalteromonas luteoviolacea]KZN40726.1 hypothetical protein N475_11400 [Pseudoalteromonas luteoviolacea DSM 6061]MBE0387785.1 hypothetical protein [Pseudoalteromonas luteoviolacea DSM 6061]TQF72544.1 DUF2141 domain-containing protein [Pseudoalteromonas luteoviolacea]
MKTLIATLACMSAPLFAAELKLTINDVNAKPGKIYIEMFKGKQPYLAGDSYTATIVRAKNGTVSTQFNNLEPGNYAIRLFHDENNNAQLDTNLFGIPTEGVSFSNNATMQFGPPSYEEMTITISQGANAESMAISY